MLNQQKTKNTTIALKGIPFDANSSYLSGAAKGPGAIRKALLSPSANLSTESIIDLGSSSQIIDAGDIQVRDFFPDIVQATREILSSNLSPVILGGDHSITYPVIKAFSEKFPDLTILHLDAHGDLYNDFEGNKFSHASPFARIMEEGLATRLIQVGIRTLTPHQKIQADRFGVEIIEMKHFQIRSIPELASPLYLSLDMDVLDPAFAPGISHYEPGGMSTRQVISILQSIKPTLVGADIVELNPDRDFNEMTAMTAAKFLKEIIDNMLRKP
jgi:agmatinase